ncbi:MAG: ATP-binding protein [Thermoplasmata archaeon]|nr:ATP-binding protein [Thermoplasmata archaeon]
MPEDPERLLQLLSETNPWWERGSVPESLAPPYRRRDFFVIRSRLQERPITALAGPRQVGKTTLMYQLIKDALAQGVAPNRILYVSFDQPGIGRYSAQPMNDAIRAYEERILREPFRTAKEPIYILLDEITKVANWHQDLKGWFDYRYPVRFLVSSSSNSELQSGAAASLVGRVTIQLLMTWKFVDVMSLRTGDHSTNDDYLQARSELPSSLQKRDPSLLFERLKRIRPRSKEKRIAIQEALDWYLLVDGFPELIKSTDVSRCAQRLDDYVKLTLAHDLYRFHQIRSSTRVLEELLSLIAGQSGSLANNRKLADPVGLDQRTLTEYLSFLEAAFMISIAHFYSKSRNSRLRKQRKIYVPNPGLLNVLRGTVDRSVLNDPSEMGHTIESVVHGYSKRLAYNLSPGPSPPVYYWRDDHGHEVDVVIEFKGSPIPIEVKYRSEPRKDLEGLHHFIQEKRPPFGIVVTRDVLDLEPPLLFIPFVDFLMLA